MIPRFVKKQLISASERFEHKAVIILGARQVGKTTVLKSIGSDFEIQGKKILYYNLDLAEDKSAIDTNSLTLLSKRLEKVDVLLIDEAQRLTDSGRTIKIIIDNFPSLKLFVTGSSAFELKNKLSDAMTGRYIDFNLYPFSLKEISPNQANSKYLFNDILRFGLYPQVFLAQKAEDKILMLDKIVESYLFKEVLAFSKVRSSEMIKNLTKALSYQIGQEVNENELSNRLGIDRKTVVSYLEILEQAFVILRIHPFSNNLRQEIGRNSKVYFLDLGIRNALIGDFNEISLRRDAGALWENFLILERIKKLSVKSLRVENYFWRTYGGAEVDWIEKSKINSRLSAFEFKFGKAKLSRGALSFRKNYKTDVKLVNQENFEEFVF